MVVLIAGCVSEQAPEGNNATNFDQYEVYNEVTEDDYVYRIFTEKAEYLEDDPVIIYAELEYIGDKKKITIYHAGSPFYFSMTEKTRNIDVPYIMILPRLSTTPIKGDPIRKEYSGGGGYGSEDEEDYVTTIGQL